MAKLNYENEMREYISNKFVRSSNFPRFEKEHQRLDNFVRELTDSGIPLRNVKTIVPYNDYFRSKAYDDSKIKVSVVPDQHIFTNIWSTNSQRFLGRSFNLFFGNGIVEYDIKDNVFGFLFSYETSDPIEIEILKRLNLENFEDSLPSEYQLRVYPANTDKIKTALEEIESVDEKLKLKPKITKYIDDLVR